MATEEFGNSLPKAEMLIFWSKPLFQLYHWLWYLFALKTATKSLYFSFLFVSKQVKTRLLNEFLK